MIQNSKESAISSQIQWIICKLEADSCPFLTVSGLRMQDLYTSIDYRSHYHSQLLKRLLHLYVCTKELCIF